ncbi:MAG: AmmeMemoRadiSam system radical SAM enzyme [Planctomycetota bacterium]|nr:AmmeMemoRadiSam system radical SAM enzyme [Planctomycetota bacterium]
MKKGTDNNAINRRAFLRRAVDVAACTGFALGAGLGPVREFLSGSGARGGCAFGDEKKNADGKEAGYYDKRDDGEVKCNLCFRECLLPLDTLGTCRVRINRGGVLYSLVHGRAGAQQIDPIEKEPVFHMLPGSTIFCTGTAGCNFRCKFCHNWEMSQRKAQEVSSTDRAPADVVANALKNKCRSVSFTYNEPVVFIEYMCEIASAAREKGLGVVVHSNGAISSEPLGDVISLASAFTIDLKAFTEKFYKDVCAARLRSVLESLEQIRKSEVHLEIVNLVIPTLNDNIADVKKMCAWIVGTLGKDVPLHFNRFGPAYKLKNLPMTPVKTLDACHDAARGAGLEFVYVGNCPGHKANSTHCPKCGAKAIERNHFEVKSVKIKDGKCESCGHAIPGVWRL